MPASRAATAICSAPLLWPSRPGLATRKRGGPPAIPFTNSATVASSPTRRPTAAFTPVGARNSPNTSRSTPAHSPVVPPALASAIDGSMMLPSPAAASCRAASAASTAAWSREPRQARTSAINSVSTAGSTVRMLPGVSRGDGSVSVKRLTPTTVCSPASMRRVRSAIDRTSRPFSSSTAAKAPPRASTSCSSAQAASRSSAVRASTTCEPSNRSPYSSRSVSNASTCCMRSDHCWSHGRGRPSASFHAGSCTLRARAFFERVTASISSTIRWMLFSGWASVRPSELTCTP